MKVLVVEDDPITRQMLQHALTEARYEVEVACDGHEALDILRSRSGRFRLGDAEHERPGAMPGNSR